MTNLTDTKQFKEACDHYQFAESIGDIKYQNEVAYKAYDASFNAAMLAMDEIARANGITFGQVLEMVRDAVAA